MNLSRDFNCFRNRLCIIIFNWIFKNLWDFDQKLRDFDIFFTSTPSINGYGQFTEFWPLRVGFGSLGVNFELLGVKVGHLGVNFRPLKVDFRLHGEFLATMIRFKGFGSWSWASGSRYLVSASQFRASECWSWASRSQIWAPGSWFWISEDWF